MKENTVKNLLNIFIYVIVLNHIQYNSTVNKHISQTIKLSVKAKEELHLFRLLFIFKGQMRNNTFPCCCW